MYDTVELIHWYLGENDPADESRWCAPRVVDYLSADDRAPYILTVKEGLLYDAAGDLFDTTDSSTIHSGGSRAIFVMLADGTIFASKHHLARRFHHSSLCAGGPVASAGEMVVVQGQLRLISNGSGHYKPSPAVNRQVIEEMRRRGVDLANISVEEVGS